MQEQQLLKNTFILTMATFISKFLGFVYVIPFTHLVGTQGFALYMYAYRPYTIMLSIATAGLPLAVSKFVSKYNELGDYRVGHRLFRSSIFYMAFSGIATFLIMYNLSPLLADYLVGDSKSGNTKEDVVLVMKCVSLALLVVPFLSISRGFFQGYKIMQPTAVSQVIEQIVRVVWILAGTFVVIKLLDKSIAIASGVATAGALVGSLAGLVVMMYFWKVKNNEINLMKINSHVNHQISTFGMYKELLSYAIPFVIVGLAIPLYQLIDTFSLNKIFLTNGHSMVQAETLNSVLGLTQTLVLIPVSLATALSLSIIPSVTALYTARNFRMLRNQVTQSFQMLLFIILPIVIGMSILSEPAYVTFFGIENSFKVGSHILRYYSPVAILFAFFTVTAAILQGINKQKFAIISLMIGLVLKMLLNKPLVMAFDEIGPIIATSIGYGASIAINFMVIHKILRYNFSVILKRFFFFLAMSTIMGLTVFILNKEMSYTNFDLRIKSLLELVVNGILGAYVYLLLSQKMGVTQVILKKDVKFFNTIFFDKKAS